MINERNLVGIISVFGRDYSIANEEKGEIVYTCPFCVDRGHRYHSDKKLYVNTNSLKWYCQRCKASGNLRYSNTYNELSSNDIVSELLNYLNDNVSNSDNDDKNDYFRIPTNLLIDNKKSIPYLYMSNRGFTDDDMKKYSMRISDGFDDFYGRIVIPNRIINNVFTDMYVARDYLNRGPRYKNPYNSRKSEILFNYHNIPDNPEYIILNEGPLNSIIAGDLSVASFGKSLSKFQKKLIFDKNPKKLYVSYDTDALNVSQKLCDEIISKSDIEVYLVELPDNKDAVDLGKDRYLDIVFSTKKYLGSRIYNIFRELFK